MNYIMITINNSHALKVDVTHHDSNEEPEKLCINQVITFKVGERIYQYYQASLEDALTQLKAELLVYSQFQLGALPDVVFCVVTRFHKQYFIDWKSITDRFTRTETVNRIIG